ncbi:putative hexose carrier protein [Aureobasidium namibiae CBS 147.97]|uniref:Putative hexose carrier protein n=1 Tax=Aureobasidium namibiae CBS 147.97 TaxID=1043004 RepID=A0A074WEF2_9PEZI
MSSSPTYMRLKGQNLVYAVTLSCSLGFLLFGYDLGFMGGLTTSPEFLATFGNPDPTLLGFLVSSYEIGALFGAVFVFLLGDRYGRRPIKLSGAGVISSGAIIQCTSFGVGQFLAGRIIAGFGLGMMTSVIPIWLAECAAPKSRGRMIAMQLSNLIMGLIIANWLDYGMASYASSIQWRFPCAFQIAFCICIACLVPFLPESPRYLAKKGDSALAINNLAALRGMTQDDPELQQEMKDIEYIVEVEQREEGTWSDVFRDGGISGSTRVLIACVANALQQLTGSNVMSSFGPYIFQKSIGMTRHQALLVSGGLQVFFFVSSIIPWFIIDRVGRRRLFLFGSTGLAICMGLSAVFVGVKGNKSLGYGAAVMLYLYQTCFTVGWMSNMWVYPSELLPLKLRLRGAALSVVFQWLATFLIVEIVPIMISNIGYKSYIVFAAINVATIPIVYFFFVETAGLPLEAVDILFADRDGKRPSILQVVRASKNKEYMAEIVSRLHMEADIQVEVRKGVKEDIEFVEKVEA